MDDFWETVGKVADKTTPVEMALAEEFLKDEAIRIFKKAGAPTSVATLCAKYASLGAMATADYLVRKEEAQPCTDNE